MVIVKAFGRMLPRIEAEESLLEAERVGVGSRAVPRDTIRSATGRWRRTAYPAHTRARAPRATPDTLPALGIGYQVVPPRRADVCTDPSAGATS